MTTTAQITVKQTKTSKMPTSEETERIVFGAVLMNPDCFAGLAHKSQDLFFSTRHKEIFLAMKALYASGQEITPVTLRQYAVQNGLEHAGTGEARFLADFTVGVPRFDDLTAYVRILDDYAHRRKIIKKARELAMQMYDLDDPQQAFRAFKADLGEMESDGDLGRIGLTRFGDAIPAQVEQWNNFLSGKVIAIESGLYELDNGLTGGGYTKGMFHALGGVPGVGKSSAAIDIAGNAVAQGKSVVYFTLELSREVFIDRFLSPFAGVQRSRIAPQWIREADVSVLTETAMALEKTLFWIDDRATTVAEMDETLRKVAKLTGGEIDVVIVDYLQRMSGTGNTEHHIVKNNVEYLCKAAKVYNTAVIALTQFAKRRPEDFFTRPQISWFKESGSIGEAARTATVLWQTEEQFNDYELIKVARRGGDTSVNLIKEVTVSVIKQGEGAEFDFTAFFDTRTMTFGVRQPLLQSDAQSAHPRGTTTKVAADSENTVSGHAIATAGNICDDLQGNKIWQTGNIVRLRLATHPDAKVLGTELGTGVLTCKRVRDKHLHRQSQSYGFSWHLVNSGRFHTYKLTDESGEYALPVEIIKTGTVMKFTNSDDGNDYELQYFLPLDKIVEYGEHTVANTGDDFNF